MFIKKLKQHLLDALEQSGYEEPIHLQKKCITTIKSGADLFCIGGENTGKTTSIVVSVINKLDKSFEDVPRALIVVVDEERALLMKEQFELLGKNTDLRVFSANEGRRLDEVRDRIYAGSDVVIGTSKKLNELYSYSGLNLNNLKMFIIDDADEVLRHYAVSEIDRLAEIVIKAQHIVFAKKSSEWIDRFSDVFMNTNYILEEK